MYAYWDANANLVGSNKKGKITFCKYCTEPLVNEEVVKIDWLSSAPYANLKNSCYILIGEPCEEWREELYRQAFEANIVGAIAHDYHEELLAEWRSLFDTTREDWKETNGWNPQVNDDPSAINYWLEFIDSSGTLGEYSIPSIGKRSKIIENDKISTVFNLYVPDIIFQENNFTTATERDNFIKA